MDPNATLKKLRNALAHGDMTEAVEATVDLASWLNGGGFEPDWPMGSTVRDWWGFADILLSVFPDDASLRCCRVCGGQGESLGGDAWRCRDCGVVGA